MKHHAFWLRAAAAAAGAAILLVSGTATGAMAAVTSTSAPSAGQESGSVPGSPTGLTTSTGDGFIALSWSGPTSTGGSPITGYHVYLGDSPSLAGARVYTTPGTSLRLTGVQNGTQYYVKVTALNVAGEGPGTPVTSVIPAAQPAQAGPSRPTGLTALARHGAVVLSWSPPEGGLKAGDGYLIYMGTSSGQEGGKPSVPYLIESVTSYTVAPLKDGTRYYFQVALLDAGNRVSARSAEVSAVPGAGTGSAGPAAAPPASPGAPAGSGASATAQSSASPLRGRELAQHRTSPSRPTGLVVLLVALVLAAAAGGATAVMVSRRRPYRPRRPHDGQPTGQFSRTEEMNGPRYR